MFLKTSTPYGTLTMRCIFMLMIHTADLHLGASPDAGEPWGKNRKQELFKLQFILQVSTAPTPPLCKGRWHALA